VNLPVAVRRGGVRPSTVSRSARGRALKTSMKRSHRLLVVRFDVLGGGGQPEPLAEAVTGRVCHVPAEPSFYAVKVLNEHIGLVARGIEQAGLGEEGDERPRLGEDSSELLFLSDHPGRVQLEVHLVEIRRGPAGEVTVDVAPLVVDGRLAGVFVELRAVLGAPGGETLLQLRASSLVAFLALR